MRKPSNQTRPLLIGGIVVCLLVMSSLLADALLSLRQWPMIPTSPDPAGGSEPGTVHSMAEEQGQSAAATETTRPAIPIHLVGAVCHPGIYHIQAGTYLFELLEAAGGLTEDAAAEQINLALRLDVNRQIYIPTREEARDNPGLLPNAAPSNPDEAPLLDLNTASAADLEQLPGIGPVTARTITDYRDKHGRFSCCEDLMRVPGIKESRFAALKDLIYVRTTEKSAP